MSSSRNIHFHLEQLPVFAMPVSKKDIRAGILFLIKSEKYMLRSLNIIFCSDEYLLQINKEFLQHDTFTDIITFDHSDTNLSIEADLYISVDRLRDNALTFNKSFASEMFRVLCHGVLHLCGYMDKNEKDQLLMRAKEEFYMNYLHL